MLALTRRKGESIIINENIEVVVVGIQGEQVKLGVIAPRSVVVHRKEIYEQIQKENMMAKEALSDTDIAKFKDLLGTKTQKTDTGE